ncbi:IMP 5'-nucleotidase ISN1 [Aspergillus undulatus]|uniref:IMP 5'-nucleotidase ISN1 n=1 Tax=Aspergillus undulatus TaxID=1810928 RepID=UPI003CCE21C1
MTTRYRVEYALKSHRRDQLIEWIKALLAVPFVLHSQPTAVHLWQQEDTSRLAEVALDTHQRYAEIFRDVERLLNDHIEHESSHAAGNSKLKLLVPTVGTFFTKLYLTEAFKYQDQIRHISRRRFVAPSFNDVRLVLNSAQILGLLYTKGLELVTFDGDVTLYDDGENLNADNPVIERIIRLLQQNIKVGIVTAAGYTEEAKYYERLKGLLDVVHDSSSLTDEQRSALIVMGGESNYLFKYDASSPHRLAYVPREQWLIGEMATWKEDDIKELLNIAEASLRACVANLDLPVSILRKDRAVGVYPQSKGRLFREQLEETVLVVQNTVERSQVASRLPFCAFNGCSPFFVCHSIREFRSRKRKKPESDQPCMLILLGQPGGNDVFVDIGDKSWGVRACQQYFGGIDPARTLHVGDQFLSAGANDFKARLASTTAWIASPAETVQLLDELDSLKESLP